MSKPLIVLTMGDPCGIGPEIIAKAWLTPEVQTSCRPFVVGDLKAMEHGIAACSYNLKVAAITTPEDAMETEIDTIPVLSTSSLSEKDMIYGQPTIASGDAVYHYICEAARLCLERKVPAMVTAPINKEAMNLAGHNYPGHTELLAELCGKNDFVMLLAGDVLRVSLVTIHEALRDVPSLITAEKVLSTIRITEAGVRRLAFKKRPKLAVLALNPHCGESGMFGDEERLHIEPAIALAQSEGINVVGPLSADTLFYFAAKGEYDGVVAMYHDQGLIPLKMTHFDDGVNCTLGLPIVRTSVDHGTAYNLAGKGVASESSLVAAIRMAILLSSW